MDPITLAAALLPLIGKLSDSLINRFIAPKDFKPATVEDAVKLADLELKKFEAMNNVGGTQISYPWVAAIVQLQRPAVVGFVLLAAGWQVVNAGEVSAFVQNALGIVGSYLFMDRTLFHLGQKPAAPAAKVGS